MLKAVFFDIDDTLHSTSEFAVRARKNSVSAMIKAGLHVPHASLVKELDEVIREFSSNYEHHFNKLLLRVPKRCYEGVNPAIIVAAGVVAYHETKFRALNPFPDVIPMLRRLAKTDLIRGIISDGLEIKQSEKLIRLGILPYLTPAAIFLSDQIGISKPNPKLYQRVCAELDISPEEAVYVGNHPLLDIDPPNKIGMITVLVRKVDKYALIKGKTKPRYSIKNFNELISILRKHYQIAC
ncbi:MAG: HAD-IA family hydrolase [Planctomycetes bacterium]|nr:HAD-IA family hydrolase [Planctomycetota bacterium]